MSHENDSSRTTPAQTPDPSATLAKLKLLMKTTLSESNEAAVTIGVLNNNEKLLRSQLDDSNDAITKWQSRCAALEKEATSLKRQGIHAFEWL